MVRNILVDTSAIYAFISQSDQLEGHTQSRKTYSEILERGDRLYTTSYVLVEFTALIHRRLGFEPLRAFMGNWWTWFGGRQWSQSTGSGKRCGLARVLTGKSGTA